MSEPFPKAQRYEMDRVAYKKPPPILTVGLPLTDIIPSMKSYARIAQGISAQDLDVMCTDAEYFGRIIKTMDAIKDTLDWVQAQTAMIEATYAKDPVRREIHLRIIRNGFQSLINNDVEGGQR